MTKNISDKTTMTGAIIGIASLFFPLITLKPNRVADGTRLSWIEVGGILPIIMIVSLFIFLIFFSSYKDLPGKQGIKIVIGILLLFLVMYLIGPVGKKLLNSGNSSGRVTLSFGFWIFAASIWVIFNGLLRKSSRIWIGAAVLLVFFAIISFFVVSGSLEKLSLVLEFNLKSGRVLLELKNHLRLAGTAVFLSILIGIPLGILGIKRKKSESSIFFLLNSIQTIPSLALFGLLIAPLSFISFHFPFLREMGVKGIGSTPALIALTLYALLPVAKNTYVGLSVVNKDIIQAGKGMGMGSVQLFFLVETPLALPVILSGIRISAIQAVGNTAIAALIGAGGFGTFIFQGLGQGTPDLILVGVIPIIVLAVGIDRILDLIIKVSVSPGVAGKESLN